MARTPWHVLLIEDSADDRADLRQMLLRGGDRRYRFSEAGLGADGVRQVLERTHGPVDCVLLDHGLPDMDAPEVLAALCRGTGLPPCPVVVITGTEHEDGRSLLGAGAQDCIGKRWTGAASLTRAVENAIERFALMAERRHADAALRRSEQRYRALFESIDAGYAVIELVVDEAGVAVDARCLQANPAFARQTGWRDAVGRTWRGLVPAIEPGWLEAFAAVARSGEPLRMERRSEALRRWFEVYAFRLGEPHEQQVAVLLVDTTERRRDAQALQAAKAEAERASRAKSDFLLCMSHELRSPLSTMLGYTQLIESGTPAPTPAQRDSVQQILHAGWYLLGLVNEILDLTTIESGGLVLTQQPVSLNEVLDDCRGMVESQAQAAGIELNFSGLPGPCRVQADATRIKQVLINLLSNAIKYTVGPGSVTVRCAAAPGQQVRVSVADTGPGLTPEQIAQLFEPFNRLGLGAGDKPGTGIGLVICKRLVEQMGGRIGVDSRVGQGSCFWFELDAVPARPVHPLPVRTVLCIEGDPLRLQHLEQLVAGRPGVCLLRAPDLCTGIEIARSARPDAIVVGPSRRDAQARQAIALLARDPATAHIPVIGPTTASPGLPGDRTTHRDGPTPQFHGDALGRALDHALQHNQAARHGAAAQESTGC
jgi:PAS domain S-box-containing protein